MKSILYLALILSVTFFNSCEDDDEEKGICERIQCSSNRICVNDQCVCSDSRFEGDNCDKQKEPTSINLTSIELIRFPSTDANGNSWDINNAPDLYITIFQSTNSIWKLPTVLENVGINQMPLINISNAEILDLGSQHTISLYDDDGNLTDQFMAGVLFTPYSESNGFPAEITIDTGGLVAYKLSLKYNF